MSENKLSFPVPAALLPRQPVHCAEFPASTVLRGCALAPGCTPCPKAWLVHGHLLQSLPERPLPQEASPDHHHL